MIHATFGAILTIFLRNFDNFLWIVIRALTITRCEFTRTDNTFPIPQLQQFQSDYETELGEATQSIDQSIERTVNNIEWMDNYYQVIADWLINNGYGPGGSKQ